MANVVPTQLIPGIDLLAASAPAPSQGLFIPLASLPGLTAIEADETTGDARKVVYELSRALFANYTALALASRPGKLTIVRGTPTGVDSTTVRQSFTFSIDLDISASDVTPEV